MEMVGEATGEGVDGDGGRGGEERGEAKERGRVGEVGG